MNNYNRDFNAAAKFFLGLSMFAVTMTIINSFLKIRLNSYMIGGYNGFLITEIIIDFLILAAAVLTFMKKRLGLIALALLFIIRMFATIPTGGALTYGYLLGGNAVLFLRDFGLFAIAMCFKKNGISGWKSFFSSVEKESDTKSASVENTASLTSGENKPNNEMNRTSVLEADVEFTNNKNTIAEVQCPSNTLSQGPQKSISKNMGNKGIGLAIGVAVIIIIGFIAIVDLKSYPEYITTFGDKFKYNLNLANDSLAEKLYDEAMDTQKHGFIAMKELNGKWQRIWSMQLYPISEDITNAYDISNAYFSTDTLKTIEDIVENAVYLIYDERYYRDNVHVWDGAKVKRHYTEILENVNPAPTIMLATSYDVKEQQRQEKILMDYAASVPVKDAEIAEDIAQYYLIRSNFNRAIDILSTAAKKSGGDSKILSILSLAFYENEDFDKAKESAQKAVKKNSKEYEALSVLYEISLDNEEWESVKKEAKKAIDFGAENPDIYYCYAEALYKLGERKEARSAYNKGDNLGIGRLSKKYAEAGGSPYDFLSFEFAFTDYDGNIVTDFGKKLYSKKSKFISPRAKVKAIRGDKAEYQCKLYYNGGLQTGKEHSTYTYDTTIGYHRKGYEGDERLIGWGSNYAGTWESGNYRFEVWFDGEKVGSEEFHIY